MIVEISQEQEIINNTKKMIYVTFEKEGIHKYPAAATDKNLATGDEYDVSFLAQPHRHIFKFKVWVEVTHNDRDLEFIQLKRWILKQYNTGILQLDYKSCEMMSDDLFKILSEKFKDYPRDIWIDVSEDGENGSFAKYLMPKSKYVTIKTKK